MFDHHRRARKYFARLLPTLLGGSCSICGSTYSGDHCKKCGWF
ncbi:hypothetical protein ACFY4C_24025 [Actinomadura viridis]